MKRRPLLGVLATGLGASAGCLAGSGDSGATPSGSTTPTGTTTRTETSTTTDQPTDAPVRISEVEVTPQFVAMNTPDSIGTYGDRDEQFLLASVTAIDSPAPPVDEFALETGEKTYSVDRDADGYGNRIWTHARPYGGDDRPWGSLAFRVPKPLDADSAAISWPGGKHALDGDAISELARPPTDWSVEFSAPEAVTAGDVVTVSLTVANVGETDGTFVAALNRVGVSVAYTPEEAISLDVPAGETATWEFEHPVSYRSSGDDLRVVFHLDWRDGGESREIAVESA